MKLTKVDTETNSVSLVCPANIENTGHVKISFLDTLEFPKEKKTTYSKSAHHLNQKKSRGFLIMYPRVRNTGNRFQQTSKNEF
ncbi:MAG: hypothetical protein R2883_01495 [Caldisericia bacterium]